MDSLSIRLFKITNAAKEGKLGALRSDLPDHYIATDKVLIFSIFYILHSFSRSRFYSNCLSTFQYSKANDYFSIYKRFFEKKIVAVIFYRTGLHTFPASNTKHLHYLK